MAVKFECEVCGKQEDAARPNKYFVAPEGWFQTYDQSNHVCGIECVKKAGGGPWRGVSRIKVLVGPKNCKWCERLDKPCPVHRTKEATPNV